MPGTEDAGRETASRRLVPGLGERDTDREGRSGDAQEEPEHQQQRVGIDANRRTATSSTGAMRHQRHDGEHDATAVPVGQRTDRDPARPSRPGSGWPPAAPPGCWSATCRLGVGGRQRADQVPGPEVDGRNPGRQRQVDPPPRASTRHCRRAHIFTEPVERCRGVSLAEILRPTSIYIGVVSSLRVDLRVGRSISSR